MISVGQALGKSKGIGKGFDFLRIFLAVMVVLNHSFLIVEGNYNTVDRLRLWTIFGAILPMFFALSGFLITGSAQRLKLTDFLLNRGIRIVPALAVDIFVSAIIIGAVFTVFPWSEYYTDGKFRHYFLNIIGFIHYELPGVFPANPFPRQMNGSLWTVPYEIGCYAVMSGLILFGGIKSKSRMVGTCIGFTLLFYAFQVWFSGHPSPFSAPTPLNNYLSNFLSSRGNYLYFYFLSGSLFYVLRDSVPFSGKLAAVCTLVTLAGGLEVFGAAKPLVMALPVGYLTVYLGLLNIPKLPLYSRGDYSYGVYLYAYPLQQMLILLFPSLTITAHFFLSVGLATGVAMLSWHLIEKPILRMRKQFSFTARKTEPLATQPTST